MQGCGGIWSERGFLSTISAKTVENKSPSNTGTIKTYIIIYMEKTHRRQEEKDHDDNAMPT
jgi:hypothetical protein